MLPAPFTPEFLNRLEALRLRTRKEVLGNRPGAYAAPRRGTSLEFADYRKYSPGDDLRYVDWGIFARSDRLYVRLFREEVDLFAYVFIDASRSMACPSPAEKFAPACRVALALGYVVLANHDRVRLHCLAEPDIPASPFYRGRHRILDLIDFVNAVEPAGAPELAAALARHLARIRRPGKAILISDFLMPAAAYQQGLNLLRAHNLDIAAVQVLSRAELDPPLSGDLRLIDSESGAALNVYWGEAARREYRGRLERHNRELKSFCHQSGVHYSLYAAGTDLSEYVLTALPAMGLFR
ncbi:MAG TPA: DUF58 domain-containing protein [Candidatus Binatia bacterium]